MGVIIDIVVIIAIVAGLIDIVGGFTDDAVLLIAIAVLLRSFRRDIKSAEQVMDCLDKATYLMKNDEPGEGIVIHRPDFVNKYGHTVWAKVVRAEFKVARKEKTVTAMPSKEAEFVSTYCTEAMILKEQSKIQPWSSKKIPQLLNTIYHELINECIWDYIKKAKNPTLNFRAIQGLCMAKTKEVIGI